MYSHNNNYHSNCMVQVVVKLHYLRVILILL